MADPKPDESNWVVPVEKKPKVPMCFECKHEIKIENTVHSSCNAPDRNHMVVVAWEKSIKNGTFNWPLSYDPTQLVECNGGFAKKETN